MTTDKSPRYLRRVLVLPLLILLFSAFATRNITSGEPDALLRFFTRHLRFPQAALEANQKGSVWFSIRVDENGKLAEFHPFSSATALGEHKPRLIAVTHKPAEHPTGNPATGQTAELFLDEARTVSQKIEEAKTPIPAGEYYIQIDFSIEDYTARHE